MAPPAQKQAREVHEPPKPGATFRNRSQQAVAAGQLLRGARGTTARDSLNPAHPSPAQGTDHADRSLLEANTQPSCGQPTIGVLTFALKDARESTREERAPLASCADIFSFGINAADLHVAERFLAAA